MKEDRQLFCREVFPITKRYLKEIAKEVILSSNLLILERGKLRVLDLNLTHDEAEYVLDMIGIYLNHLRQYMGK